MHPHLPDRWHLWRACRERKPSCDCYGTVINNMYLNVYQPRAEAMKAGRGERSARSIHPLTTMACCIHTWTRSYITQITQIGRQKGEVCLPCGPTDSGVCSHILLLQCMCEKSCRVTLARNSLDPADFYYVTVFSIAWPRHIITC